MQMLRIDKERKKTGGKIGETAQGGLVLGLRRMSRYSWLVVQEPHPAMIPESQMLEGEEKMGPSGSKSLRHERQQPC